MARVLWMPDALRAAGLEVSEPAGWKTRGGSDYAPQGIIVHATAGPLTQSNDSAYNVLVNGREGLPGPISQVMLERGTHIWRMVCSGRSNHAKTGWAGNCAGLGNSNLIGIEWHHNNSTEPVSETAFDVYARGVAAMCRALGIGVNRVALHKEHQPGEKSDTVFSGAQFRARVQHYITGGGILVTTETDVRALYVTEFEGNGAGTTIGKGIVPPNFRGTNDSKGNATVSQLIYTVESIKLLLQKADEDKARDELMKAAIDALTAAINAGGGNVDTAVIIKAVNDRATEIKENQTEAMNTLGAVYAATAVNLSEAEREALGMDDPPPSP